VTCAGGYNAASDAGLEEDAMAGEAPITQAVKWMDDQLVDHPDADRLKLVDDAARRFDLTPLDTEFLFRHLAQKKRQG
jgi:hypothetical protein